MTNVGALKALYTAIGGDADLTGVNTIVGVLNAIAVKLGGTGGNLTNAEAIADIATVASSAVAKLEDKTVTPSTSEQNHYRRNRI